MTPGSPRWRRWFSPWNVVTLVALVWAAPRLLPHLGAVIGIDSGRRAAPQYLVATLDGGSVSSASLRGKVVLVNFWATWCAPCRVEMPLLERMYARHHDAGFVLLGLSVDRGGAEPVRRFLQERNISYPVAVVGAEVERAFGGIRGYPTSFLIDRRGVVRHEVIGPLAPATLELAAQRLLAEKGEPTTTDADRPGGAPSATADRAGS